MKLHSQFGFISLRSWGMCVPFQNYFNMYYKPFWFDIYFLNKHKKSEGHIQTFTYESSLA